MRTNNFYHAFFMGAALVLGMASCSSSSDIDSGSTRYMLPETKQMQLTAPQQALVADNNDFSFNLFRSVNATAESPNASRVLSPISVTYMLGMVGNGAEGETLQQINSTLGFSGKGIREVNELCQALITQAPELDKQVTLETANAIYVNKGYTLKSAFKANMTEFYKGDAQTFDFHDSDFLPTINGWAARQTHGMIDHLLDKVKPDAVSYLLNAVYFQAKWTKQFEEKNTRTETFTREDGTTVQRSMMHNNALVATTTNDTYTMVCLPYGSGTVWNMMVLLPREGKTVADVLGTLNSTTWKQSLTQRQPMTMDIKIPKFDTSTNTDLIKALTPIGVVRLFNPRASEIPNMCESANLYVSNMLQKARIEVNEEGTKATAVTVAEMGLTSAGPAPAPETGVFHANRPFVYVISENNSDAIFFIGTYMGQ